MNILVSSCLLGNPCRYDGGSKPNQKVIELAYVCRLIPVCSEVLGGLSIPRPPAELRFGRMIDKEGRDVTEAFHLGAEKTLALAQEHNCRYAILKERSPSCGKNQIYDGTFSKTLTPGDGVTASLLMKHGISVYGESETEALLKDIKQEAEEG